MSVPSSLDGTALPESCLAVWPVVVIFSPRTERSVRAARPDPSIFACSPQETPPRRGFTAALSLEGIHSSSCRTAKSIGLSALPVPDDDHGMKRYRNTDTQVALSPKGGMNQQEKAKKMAENGPARFQDGCNFGGRGSKFSFISYQWTARFLGIIEDNKIRTSQIA